jgi:hypothetical protein
MSDKLDTKGLIDASVQSLFENTEAGEQAVRDEWMKLVKEAMEGDGLVRAVLGSLDGQYVILKSPADIPSHWPEALKDRAQFVLARLRQEVDGIEKPCEPWVPWKTKPPFGLE